MDTERHRMRKSEIHRQHGGRIGCLENWWDHPEEAHSEKGLMEEPLGREFSQKSREVTSGQNKDLVIRGRQTAPRPGDPIQLMDIGRNPGDTRLGAKTEGGVLITNQPDLGAPEKKSVSSPLLPRAAPTVLQRGRPPWAGAAGVSRRDWQSSEGWGSSGVPKERPVPHVLTYK